MKFVGYRGIFDQFLNSIQYQGFSKHDVKIKIQTFISDLLKYEIQHSIYFVYFWNLFHILKMNDSIIISGGDKIGPISTKQIIFK